VSLESSETDIYSIQGGCNHVSGARIAADPSLLVATAAVLLLSATRPTSAQRRSASPDYLSIILRHAGPHSLRFPELHACGDLSHVCSAVVPARARTRTFDEAKPTIRCRNEQSCKLGTDQARVT
jgi:hypothetical protein